MNRDCYYEIRLYDPAECSAAGYPTFVAVTGLELTRPRAEIHTNEQLQQAIVRILTDQERQALFGGNPFLEYQRCCVRCGGALGLTTCQGCKRTYRDDQCEPSEGIELPLIVRQHLVQHGHSFEQ